MMDEYDFGLVCIGSGPAGQRAAGGGMDYFLETVFRYPTLADCYSVAALDAFSKRTLRSFVEN